MIFGSEFNREEINKAIQNQDNSLGNKARCYNLVEAYMR